MSEFVSTFEKVEELKNKIIKNLQVHTTVNKSFIERTRNISIMQNSIIYQTDFIQIKYNYNDFGTKVQIDENNNYFYDGTVWGISRAWVNYDIRISNFNENFLCNVKPKILLQSGSRGDLPTWNINSYSEKYLFNGRNSINNVTFKQFLDFGRTELLISTGLNVESSEYIDWEILPTYYSKLILSFPISESII